MNKHHQYNYIVLFTVTCDLTTKANGEKCLIFTSLPSPLASVIYIHIFLNQADQRFIFRIDLLCPLTYDVPCCGNVPFVYVC